MIEIKTIYKLKILKSSTYLAVWLWLFISLGCRKENDEQETRTDGATRLTYSAGNQSCQNPAFSPDGKYILFTRFLNGYNKGPSELVKINLSNKEESVIISANNADNVNVPGPSWINGKICWASDRAGGSDEIYIANDDGTNIQQITDHSEEGYYIEPVFNPTDINKIIFEHGPSDYNPHRIGIVELDKDNRVTFLTEGTTYDDRLPNWSFDGNTILFQRANAGNDNWQIYTATIVFTDSTPFLANITQLPQPNSHNTDNSWYIDNQYILSSSDYNIEIPNIYAFPINGNTPIRITTSENYEDGAPSCSHNGEQVAFESHKEQDENTPSEIWIIEAPNELCHR